MIVLKKKFPTLYEESGMTLHEESDDDDDEEEEARAGAARAVEEDEAARVKAAEEEAARLKAVEDDEEDNGSATEEKATPQATETEAACPVAHLCTIENDHLCCGGNLLCMDDVKFWADMCTCGQHRSMSTCMEKCAESTCKHADILCPGGFSLVDYQDGGSYCTQCNHMVCTDVAKCDDECGCTEQAAAAAATAEEKKKQKEAARVKAAEEEAARLKAARLKEKEDLAHEFAQALLSLGNGDSAPYKVVTSETAMKEMVTKFLKAAARQDNPNVTVGWHWTSARNVEKIKKVGLLNQAERKLVDPLYSAAVHGSCYGDGVYMGETANSFSGQYGDTCLFCLILRGNEHQLTWFEEVSYQYHFSQFYAASAENSALDTVVGNKTRGGPVVDRKKNEVDCYLRAHYVLLTVYSQV